MLQKVSAENSVYYLSSEKTKWRLCLKTIKPKPVSGIVVHALRLRCRKIKLHNRSQLMFEKCILPYGRRSTGVFKFLILQLDNILLCHHCFGDSWEPK